MVRYELTLLPGQRAARRPVAQVAFDLQISAQMTYTWRRQQLIDSDQIPGMTSSGHAELVAARSGSRNWKTSPRSTAGPLAFCLVRGWPSDADDVGVSDS